MLTYLPKVQSGTSLGWFRQANSGSLPRNSGGNFVRLAFNESSCISAVYIFIEIGFYNTTCHDKNTTKMIVVDDVFNKLRTKLHTFTYCLGTSQRSARYWRSSWYRFQWLHGTRRVPVLRRAVGTTVRRAGVGHPRLVEKTTRLSCRCRA